MNLAALKLEDGSTEWERLYLGNLFKREEYKFLQGLTLFFCEFKAISLLKYLVDCFKFW